jgi:hypothetical protein
MDPALIVILAFLATLVGGMAIGFMFGITKGLAMGARCRTDRPLSPLPWIICLVASGIFLLAAIGSTIYSIYFLTNSTPAKATITKIVTQKNEEGHVSHTPVYTYKNSVGEEFTDRSHSGDGSGWEAGDTIPIRYLENAPNQSRIDSFSHHWLLPIVMAIFSLLLGTASFGFRWWRKKELQEANKRLLAG